MVDAGRGRRSVAGGTGRATHRAAGLTTVLAGLLTLPLSWFGIHAACSFAVLAAGVAVPVVYPYLAWRREVHP